MRRVEIIEKGGRIAINPKSDLTKADVLILLTVAYIETCEAYHLKPVETLAEAIRIAEGEE